jgi:hypothetical protein
LVAVGVVVVAIILIVLGVNSCISSSRITSLKDYNDNVSSLQQQSLQTSNTLFSLLSPSAAPSNATGLQNQINQTRQSAENQLNKAKGLSVPDEMRSAQQNFVLTMQMRSDGIADIAQQIQPALGKTTSQDAINSMATDMARFYSSDVTYILYTTPLIAEQLHGAGINNESVQGGQFLPNLQWLTPSYISSQLHVSSSSGGGGGGASGVKNEPGLHGHSLNSVSVSGTTLSSSGNNIPASPAPTFALNITNGGQYTETNVVCKVTVSGTSSSGTTTLPQTSPNETTNCNVTLNASPPKGTFTVSATVEPVAGEKNTANNTLSFPVTFT